MLTPDEREGVLAMKAGDICDLRGTLAAVIPTASLRLGDTFVALDALQARAGLVWRVDGRVELPSGVALTLRRMDETGPQAEMLVKRGLTPQPVVLWVQ